MRHARSDYDRIQDPEERIGRKEPVFVLRGQDVNAPAAVEYWALMTEGSGGDPEMVRAVRAWAEEMRTWQREHGSKVADVPEGALGQL